MMMMMMKKEVSAIRASNLATGLVADSDNIRNLSDSTSYVRALIRADRRHFNIHTITSTTSHFVSHPPE